MTTDYEALFEKMRAAEGQVPEGWLTTREISEATGYHASKVRELIRSGVAAGLVECQRIRRPSLMGTGMSCPQHYRIKPDGEA